MYRKLILLFSAFVWVCATAQAQGAPSLKLPLLPVTPDSVTIEDFFWYGQLQEAGRNFPSLKPTRLKAPKKEYRHRERLSQSWQAALSRLDPSAMPGGAHGLEALHRAADFASLSSRLNLATADARYANIFEYVAANAFCGRQQSADVAEREVAARVLAGVPGQIYATSGNHLFLNCMIRNSAHIVTEQLDVKTTLITSRPWYNQVILWFKFKKQGQHMVLHVALPEGYQRDSIQKVGAAAGHNYYEINVGGRHVRPRIENGYLVFDRHWSDSDYVAIDFPIFNLRLTSGPEGRNMSILRGPIVYSTLNMPQGMYVKASDAIHSEFDKQRHTNVLSAPYYDAHGNKAGEYIAEPYLFNRRNPQARVAYPFLP